MPYPTQPVFDGLTPAQVASIKADIIALVPFDQRTSCTQSSLACTDVLGGLVQLAFHDAGTFDKATGTGGPDGCIDLTLPENHGLRWIAGVIAPVFRKYASVISFADFVVLAAKGGDKPVVISETNVGAPIYSTPIVANGTMYIGSQTHLFAVGSDAKPVLTDAPADGVQVKK